MRSAKRQAKGGRARRRVATAVVGLLGLATAALVVLVGSGWWRMDPVLSWSMRPAFPVGGVVVAERVPVSSVGVGDVVLFTPPWAPGATYVHRIIGVRRAAGATTIRTKGDANAVADPAPVTLTGRTIYEARFVVPVVGYVAVWCHSPAGELELAGGALVGALAAAGVAGRERRRGGAVGARGTGGRHVVTGRCSRASRPSRSSDRPVGAPAGYPASIGVIERGDA